MRQGSWPLIKTSRSVKLIKSSATSTTVENRKKRGNQLGTSTKIHPTSFLRLSHNVFLTTSFSQRFPYIHIPSPQNITIYE